MPVMIERKADAAQIKEFLQSLGKADWVARSERRWWPEFVYHYTDIGNAAAVLRDGYLCSRAEAERRGVLSISSGAPEILDGTQSWVKECVRLYFRPKTPTQYHAEGIKSKQTLAQSPYRQAHCPVPVFLLFDAVDTLTRADCQFSNGNLRRLDVTLGSTATELAALPWVKIYHNTAHPRTSRDIVFHKNAEVVVHQKLCLDSLRYIICRSPAEKETLLSLLSPDQWQKHHGTVTSTQAASLFYRLDTFVMTTQLFADHLVFGFSPDTRSPGPFHLHIEVVGESGPLTYADEEFIADSRLRLNLKRSLERYQVRLTLDGYLAYAGRYQEIPW